MSNVNLEKTIVVVVPSISKEYSSVKVETSKEVSVTVLLSKTFNVTVVQS